MGSVEHSHNGKNPNSLRQQEENPLPEAIIHYRRGLLDIKDSNLEEALLKTTDNALRANNKIDKTVHIRGAMILLEAMGLVKSEERRATVNKLYKELEENEIDTAEARWNELNEELSELIPPKRVA